MHGRRLLFITDRSLTAYRWQLGRLVDAHRFDRDEDGAEHFRLYLEADRHCPNHALLDLLGEEFRTETVPRVGRHERHQLLERSVAKAFRNTPFRHFETQGRLAAGRRADRVLLSAVTNPEPLQHWLEVLDAARAPLAGITSLAHLIGVHAHPLTGGGNTVLVASVQRTSGLRQTVLCDGRLVVSRLAPLRGDPEGEAFAEMLATELQKTRLYLQGRQVITGDAVIDAHFIGGQATLGQLQQVTVEGVHLHARSIRDTATALGLGVPAEMDAAETLFAELFLRKPTANRYAGRQQRRHQALARVRVGINATAMAVALAGFATGGAWAIDAVAARIAAERARQQADHYRQLTAAQATDVAPTGAEAMRDAVVTAGRLAATPMTPGPALAQVGKVLMQFPEFRLERLRWKAGALTELVDQGTYRVSDTGDRSGTALHYAVTIEGRIEPFDGDYRRALARLDALVAALATGAFHAEATQRPLQVGSETALHGSASQSRSDANRAPFAVTVVYQADVPQNTD